MACAMTGDCGRTSPFGPPLPCSGWSQPKSLDAQSAAKLKQLCGPHLANNPVCCTPDQIDALESNLKRAEALVGSCPSCKNNFFSVFCNFVCSPTQTSFIDITRNETSLTNETVVAELDYYLDPETAKAVYDSCSDVKFSATNSRAMDLLGGGATEYKAFFKFLGDKKPLVGGSPFQMNFPWEPQNNFSRLEFDASLCSDPGPNHCSCIDCPAACPSLVPLDPPGTCSVYGVSCTSLVLLIGYFLCILCGSLAYIRLQNNHQSRLEIQRLIDDDEHDITQDHDSLDIRPFVPETYKLNSVLQNWLSETAYFCARFPYTVITFCILFVLVSCLGLLWVDVIKEPEKLWVGPNSLEAREKAFFDNNFGPFYRSLQVFAVNETGPILQNRETLEWWFEVEKEISTLRSNNTKDTLESFCLAPVGPACVIQSVTQYFGGNVNKLPKTGWENAIARCANSPVNCLPPFQQPIDPKLAFGPYNDSVSETRALVSTFVLENSNDKAYISRVGDWELLAENLLLRIQQQATRRGLRFSFNVESSLERELNKSSNTDAKIVLCSYLMMFLYASIALSGRIRKKRMPTSKFSLGLFGVVTVLLSVCASAGICALLGYDLTLIITEVIPFLVLAVGVDNIFLLVHSLDFVNQLYPQYCVDDRIALAVGFVGPSIALSSSCEIVAIAIGASVAMPAVKNFAVYSAVAVTINTLLQFTMFVSAMTLDQKNIVRHRFDLVHNSADPDSTQATDTLVQQPLDQQDPRRFSFIFTTYAPKLLRRTGKQIIMLLFLCWLAVSLTLIPSMKLGLDQRLAVPSDSFLVEYYSDVYDYLGTGPPVYFVTNNQDSKHKLGDVRRRAVQQNLCARFSPCSEYSLMNILEQERKRPEVSYIASPAASWIDDFFQFLNPELNQCCLEDKKGRPCTNSKDCHVCYENKTYDFAMNGFPEKNNFTHYLNNWLNVGSDKCPLGGKAPYSSAINSNGDQVLASNFRTSHVRLTSQDDYIEAYAAARRVAEDITNSTGIETFPYSIFYVFFAQYGTIVFDTLRIVSLALALVFLLSSLMLGSPRTAFVLTIVVAVMMCNIAGLLVLFGVSLNALSLVNLVICVGIGVEFCIHIVRAYTFVHKINFSNLRSLSRPERALNALVGTGGTVFGGIALTKCLGVAVLAFTRSKIFEIYYFRMWAALVICATLHSMLFLPVMLSMWGGRSYLIEAVGFVDQFGEFDI